MPDALAALRQGVFQSRPGLAETTVGFNVPHPPLILTTDTVFPAFLPTTVAPDNPTVVNDFNAPSHFTPTPTNDNLLSSLFTTTLTNDNPTVVYNFNSPSLFTTTSTNDNLISSLFTFDIDQSTVVDNFNSPSLFTTTNQPNDNLLSSLFTSDIDQSTSVLTLVTDLDNFYDLTSPSSDLPGNDFIPLPMYLLAPSDFSILIDNSTIIFNLTAGFLLKIKLSDVSTLCPPWNETTGNYLFCYVSSCYGF